MCGKSFIRFYGGEKVECKHYGLRKCVNLEMIGLEKCFFFLLVPYKCAKHTLDMETHLKVCRNCVAIWVNFTFLA